MKFIYLFILLAAAGGLLSSPARAELCRNHGDDVHLLAQSLIGRGNLQNRVSWGWRCRGKMHSETNLKACGGDSVSFVANMLYIIPRLNEATKKRVLLNQHQLQRYYFSKDEIRTLDLIYLYLEHACGE